MISIGLKVIKLLCSIINIGLNGGLVCEVHLYVYSAIS